MRKVTAFFGLTFSATMVAAAGSWPQFHSTAHFSVMYPATWIQIGDENGLGASKEQLAILSSRGGAEGVVIRRDQAEIIVAEEKDDTKPLAEVIARYTRDTVVLSKHVIQNDTKGRPCRKLAEVVSEEPASGDPAIPWPKFIYTQLFCQTEGRTFVTILKNFAGNHHQHNYQRIAEQIAKSIRPVH